MNADGIRVKRTGPLLEPDQSRVLLRPFNPGNEHRVCGIVARIMLLPDHRVESLLGEIMAEFSQRHYQIERLFIERFHQIRPVLPPDGQFSEQRQLLIGSYFLAEYSLESAALFNPSIVPHPDQSGVPAGALRFVLSLRATGEGHISSITFRTGMIHPDHRIEVQAPSGFLTEPRQTPNARYEKGLFERKLSELGLTNDFTRRVMHNLQDWFELKELDANIHAALRQFDGAGDASEHQSTADGVWMVAKSNCEVQFQPEQELSERVIFPTTPSQQNGIEDARFVRFQNDNGSHVYYATFTAYDGRVIMPELVETSDFLHFRFITLNGPAAQNKGMAIFPRKIDGRYAMLSRQDNESIYIMYSDNIHFWNERTVTLKPVFPWELIQIGNCGSPIETDAGWLVLSHGVGPLRKYCIGAFLLDREDPAKVIGRLQAPLLKPDQNEREGYVPNVVYTCGALLHNGHLIIPYGLADHATSFATVQLDDLIAAMQ